METIKIRNLTFYYPESAEPALSDVSLSIEAGEMIVLCGSSGCGKTTLLRQLKPHLAPHGVKSGEILLSDVPVDALDARAQAQKIGFVRQSCEHQIVTDKVWHELAFGAESLGLPNAQIRRRVAETASFFGMESWFHKDVSTLSGGQKQLLSLASVMVMQPSVLILDEPTAQLDPIAASEFLQMLAKINRELGTTILLSEHRLEEAFCYATRVAVLEQGRLLGFDTPQKIGALLQKNQNSMASALPSAMRIWSAVGSDAPCPVTVREGKRWLLGYASSHLVTPKYESLPQNSADTVVLSAKDIHFRYCADTDEVVRGLSLSVKKGDFLAILGGNGAGKSTTLSLLCGILSPTSGSVSCCGRVGLLPQDVQTLFVKKTVREDLYEIFSQSCVPKAEQTALVSHMVHLCRLDGLLSRHPYDLSGGEQQRLALCKVLLTRPEILLLDEPTKGLDSALKQELCDILAKLRANGTTIIMVSHDVEFCAENATACALFFDGSIACISDARSFFSGNRYYTTAANRIAADYIENAVTVGDVILSLGGTLPPKSAPPQEDLPLPPVQKEPSRAEKSPLPLWRRLLALFSGIAAAVLLVPILKTGDLSALFSSGGFGAAAGREFLLYGAFLLLLITAVCALSSRAPMPPTVFEKKPLSSRTKAASMLVLLAIPLTLFLGSYVLSDRKYYFISLLVLIECSLPFFLIFEGRKPQPRELTVIAVLAALGVAGRAAFFMLPSFKPVMAICILSGIALGGEAGFLVGAMTMLLSNVLFSQGPWTPWQMFAMGIIGFLAGIVFRKGFLARTRLSMALFGAACAIVLYGGIMNFSSALLWAGALNRRILLSYYLSGFPVDCVHAVATFFFLFIAGEPMLEKLDRIKVKYGLIA